VLWKKRSHHKSYKRIDSDFAWLVVLGKAAGGFLEGATQSLSGVLFNAH